VPAQGDACPKQQYAHIGYPNVADESAIEALPNELLVRVLPVPWIAALVCSRWREMIDVRPAGNVTLSNRKRTRDLRASSVLDLWGSRPPDEIHTILYGALRGATLAHLLPLLVASDQPVHVDYALKLWFDEDRSIDWIEAYEWVAVHRQLDARFDAAWPDHVSSRANLDCNHNPSDVRAFASCVLLSMAARHTQSPDVLQKIAALCRRDDYTLRKAALVAIAADRHDVFGAFLYLYAQHLYGDDVSGAQHPFNEHAVGASRHNAVVDAFKMFYAAAGTYGSLACVHIIDLFLFHKSVTPSMIMSPAWAAHMRCKLCGGANLNRDGEWCVLGKIGCIMLYCVTMRTTHLQRAAIAADRPETLGAYLRADRNLKPEPILGDAARLGKARLCDAILAACPDVGATARCEAIDDISNDIPFTIEGVRWLASQTWYSPQDRQTVRYMLDDLFYGHRRTVRGVGTVASDAVRLRNTIEAVGLMVDRWPALLCSALTDQHYRVSSMLAACILHEEDNACSKEDLFGALVRHLDRCNVFPCGGGGGGGSPMANAWSYLIDAVGLAVRRPIDQRTHCPLCRAARLAIVFAHIAMRCHDNPCNDIADTLDRDTGIRVHAGTIKLRAIPSDYAGRTLLGHTTHSYEHLRAFDDATRYLAQHNLLANNKNNNGAV